MIIYRNPEYWAQVYIFSTKLNVPCYWLKMDFDIKREFSNINKKWQKYQKTYGKTQENELIKCEAKYLLILVGFV